MHLPEWQERAPPLPPGSQPIDPDEVCERLDRLLGATAESRPGQRTYARAVTAAMKARGSE